jgi:hypothetical protein
MSRINLVSFILCGATVTLALSIGAGLAQASYICPSGPGAGERQVGMTGGGNGVAAVPVCEETNYSGGSSTNSGGSNSNSGTSRPDPMRAKIDQSVGLIRESLDLMKLYETEKKKLIADPKYQAYLQGAWEFFQDRNGAAPGESCAALFSKKDGLVMVSGPGSGYQGALLTFWGKDIPRPNQVEKVKVTLTQQANEPPQTVQAFNYVQSGIEYGAITFAVPTIESALATMEDVLSFDLAIKGKSVAKIEWHSGLAARDRLSKCVSARIKK